MGYEGLSHAGQSSALVIRGEAGIGKTALRRRHLEEDRSVRAYVRGPTFMPGLPVEPRSWAFSSLA
jgi:tRNA A37 threonylcarbamoyladenosine biosynthesis protein TsaE